MRPAPSSATRGELSDCTIKLPVYPPPLVPLSITLPLTPKAMVGVVAEVLVEWMVKSPLPVLVTVSFKFTPPPSKVKLPAPA